MKWCLKVTFTTDVLNPGIPAESSAESGQARTIFAKVVNPRFK